MAFNAVPAALQGSRHCGCQLPAAPRYACGKQATVCTCLQPISRIELLRSHRHELCSQATGRRQYLICKDKL